MKLQKITQQRLTQISTIPLTFVFGLILISLPCQNDAAHVRNCDPSCAPGGQVGMDCVGCCRRWYGNNLAKGSCTWGRQPKKCMCEMPISRRPSFFKSQSSARSVKLQQKPQMPSTNCKGPMCFGGAKPTKAEPICLKEINTARTEYKSYSYFSDRSNLKPLKYHSGLQVGAKRMVEYMINHDCFGKACKDIPKYSKLLSFFTRRSFSMFDDVMFNGAKNEKLDCKKFVEEMSEDPVLRSEVATHVGCFAKRCETCKIKLYLDCMFGG